MLVVSSRESITLLLLALEARLQTKPCITICGCVSTEVGVGESADSSKLFEAGLRYSV